MEKLKKNRRTIIFLILFIILGVPLQASQQIVNVDFEGVLESREADARGMISSLEGTPYSERLIKQDIKALYKTGLYEDVYVEKKSVAGGIHLIFHVSEKGLLGSIQYKGNRKLKKKDFDEVVTVRLMSLVDEKGIAESEAAIRKLYEDKGYYAVDVEAEIVPYSTETNEKELIFHINESRPVRIKRISFVGNESFSDKKLSKQLKTKVKGFFSFLSSSGKLKDEKLEYDIQALTYFYLNQGFIKVKVGKPQISLTRDKEALYITFPLFEGPKYKMDQVDVAGDIITSREELATHFQLKKGDVYSRQKQDQDMQYLSDLYGDRSYAFANVYPSIQTDDENKTAQLVYMIDKGKKIRIEKIKIFGNTITRDKVIRREIKVQENSPFNKSAIDLSKKRLMQLGYFEDVNFSNPRGSTDDQVNLVVKVKEKPTGTFSVGAGFSSLESFIFTAAVQKNNFFGYGVSGGLSTSISKLRQEFSLNVSDRYFFDTRWIVSASVFRFSSALNRDFDERSFGGSLSFGRELFDFFDVTLGYHIEDVEIRNFSAQVPAFFRGNASGLTSSAITQLAYDTRNNRMVATKGIYQAVTSEYAGNGIGGDNNFWKVGFDSRVFIPLKKAVLKGRGLFGYVNSLDDQPVPLFERYFLGGINTLRGFDLNSVGPKMKIPQTLTGGDGTFTFGGNRMLLFNLECEIPLYDPAGLRSVVFLDSGQSYAEDEQIDPMKFRSNYGFGVRWISPFGPLRFEWGFPIKRKSGESFTVFNFSIGQSF